MPTQPPLSTATPALILDGTWLFHVYGQVRGNTASLALRLRLDVAPPHNIPAALLTGDLDRPGVLSLLVHADGRVCLVIRDQVERLMSSKSLPLGMWSTVTLRYDRKAGRVALTVAGSTTFIEGFAAEVGIDLDTITIGGERLLPHSSAFHGQLAEVRLGDRWWSDDEAARPFELPVDQSCSGWWRLEHLRRAQRAHRWSVPSLCGDNTEAAANIRLDSIDGGGGSIGTIGAFVLPANLSQPEPVTAIDRAALARLGFTDPQRSSLQTVPAWSWEAGLPTGNGEHGALILGRPCDEVVVINRAGLYLPLHQPIAPPSQAQLLPHIRSLLTSGEFQRAADLVVERSHQEGYTTEKRWTDPFIPAAFLRIDHPFSGNCSSYLRGTDYTDGTVAVCWHDLHGEYRRRTMVSRADDVIAIDISGLTGQIACRLSLLCHDPETALDGPVPSAPVGPSNQTAEPGWLFCRQEYKHSWSGSIRAAVTVARVITDGDSQLIDDQLSITGASRVLVLIRTMIQHQDESVSDLSARIRTKLTALPAAPETLWSRHRAIHAPLFARCQFSLGATDEEHLCTTAELHADLQVGSASRPLIEKTFYACRHLALCSSGQHFPPNLQGIWGGSWRASWSGDYTQNGNLQTAVAGHLAGSMPEAMEGFFAYQESLLPHYRENARVLFGARGIQVPSRTSTHGKINHFDGTWPMTFWTAGAAWNAHFFFDRWLHTGDDEFLVRRALPFMRDAALFYEDFLAGLGTASFKPSYSPENDSPATGSQSTIDAAMDVCAARQLLEDLLSLTDTGLITADEVLRWRNLRGRLPALRINDDGALAEWGDPRLTDRHEHRHASQLYAFYDGLPQWMEDEERLLAAACTTVDRRMAHRRAAGGGIMAFGMVQLGCAAASLRMSRDTGDIINWLVSRFFFPESLVSTHNPRHVFNIDIAGGLPRLMLLALVDSRPGLISVLPALPPQWQQGTVKGISCRGGIEMVKLAWNRQMVEVQLLSHVDQEIELRLSPTTESFSDQMVTLGDGRYRVKLTHGIQSTYRFERGTSRIQSKSIS